MNLFWHPYQKLWNTPLLNTIRKYVKPHALVMALKYFIIYLDTGLLFLRMLGRKYSKVPNASGKPAQILVFDLGTHAKGEEAVFIVDNILDNYSLNYKVHSFEASPQLYDKAVENLKDYSDIILVNKAVCYEVPPSGKLKLFTSDKDLGYTLFEEDNIENYSEVDVVRLSDYINTNKINLSESINMLRMNIEGAEYDVLLDLHESNMLSQFHGFYGMWDDIEKKLGSEKKIKANKLLKEYKIKPFTFNGRDLKWKMRRWIIVKDLKNFLIKMKFQL